MINNIDYNGQFNLEVVSKLHDKLDKIKKENDKCCDCQSKFYNDYELCIDRSVVLDIGLLHLLISNDVKNCGEDFLVNYAIQLIERILSTPLYNIEDSEFNKDYMVELLNKLKKRV